MPSGKSLRIWAIASRMSLTARSVGVPIWNWMNVWLLPSRTELSISSTPVTPRTAASTFWVIWVSISLGAAPGCEMTTVAPGKSMSGLLVTLMPWKASSPASISPMKNTIGGTGFLMHQEEILRKLIAVRP